MARGLAIAFAALLSNKFKWIINLVYIVIGIFRCLLRSFKLPPRKNVLTQVMCLACSSHENKRKEEQHLATI
jgi:hypothetical protein